LGVRDQRISDMSERNKKGVMHENLLEILDNVIHQLDFTKKMIIIMVTSFFTIVPITAIIINVIANRTDLQFVIPLVTFLVFFVWLGVGIRQWIVFSRWKRKYEEYKTLQKRLEESLDFEKRDKQKDDSAN
jgi:ABC-type transport system involved in Fe-S cluster assembly fused permease/ATPase subunit